MKGLKFHDEVSSGNRLLPCPAAPLLPILRLASREAPDGMKGPLDDVK